MSYGKAETEKQDFLQTIDMTNVQQTKTNDRGKTSTMAYNKITYLLVLSLPYMVFLVMYITLFILMKHNVNVVMVINFLMSLVYGYASFKLRRPSREEIDKTKEIAVYLTLQIYLLATLIFELAVLNTSEIKITVLLTAIQTILMSIGYYLLL